MKFPSLSLLSISQIGALFAAGGGFVEGKKYNRNDLTFKDDKSFRYIHTNKAGVTFDLGGCDYVDEKPTKRCKKKIDGVVVAEKCQKSCKKYLKKKLQPSLEGERLHVGCDAYVFKSNIQCDIFGENDPDLCMIQMVIVGQLSPEGTTIANGFQMDSYPAYDDDINDLDGETACMSTGVFSLDRIEGRDLKPIPLITTGAGCSAMGLATPPDYQFVVKGRMNKDGSVDLSFSQDMGFTYYTDSYLPDAPYLYKASVFTGDSTRRELAGESLYFSAPTCYVTRPGVDDAEICQREVLTRLDFTQAVLTESTLHLPDQSGKLVYSNIGQLRGEAIDLVVRQAPNSKPYSTSKPELNGYHTDDPNQKFGNVNVQTLDPSDPDYSDEEKELMDGQVELEFCFQYAGTDQKAKVDTFSFVLFDLDNRRTGLQEKITIDTSQASRFFVERETEVKMWCEGDDPSSAVSTGTFQYIDEEDGEELEGNYYATLLCEGNTIFHATTHGTGKDNPNDPTDLNQKQLSRAVEFRFDNTECWTLKFEHYCPCVDDGDDDNYCGQPGAPRLCESNKWCPKPGDRNFNPDFPDRCRSYSGGNLVFAGGADERLAEGECVTPDPPPDPCDEPDVLTEIDFSRAELIENTLHYEDQSGRLRYKNIGVSRDVELDLVVAQAPGSNPYTTIVPNKNGYNLELGGAGPKFGNINIQTIDPKDGRYSDEEKELMNGEVELEFCFYKTGTEEKARPDSFIFTLYDLDLRDGGVQERLTIDTGTADRFYVNEVNEVRMWCEGQDPSSSVEAQKHQYSEGQGEPFGVDIQTYDAVQCPPGVKTIFQSTTVGVESDNPQDPSVGLNEQQMARSIEFRFKNAQCWTIKYEHFCPCEDDDDEEDFCAQPGGPECTSWCPRWKRGRCKWYSGANLVFAGKAEAQLNPVCPDN